METSLVWFWPQSVRARLTLWYSIALGVMLAVFAASSFYVLRRVLTNRSDRFLEQARDSYITELRVEAVELRSIPDAIRAAANDVQFQDMRFIVYDAALDLPAPDGPIPRAVPVEVEEVWKMDPRRLVPIVDSVRTTFAPEPIASTLSMLPDSDGGYRLALRSVQLGGARHVVVAVQSRHPLQGTLRSVAIAFAVAIPAFLAFAAAGGYLLARRALSPVIAMSRRAREITATNLHDRLPVTNPRDELGGLAVVINDLLGRLDDSFQQQRRFVADASHELRTPVAIIRGEADIALGRPRDEAVYRETLQVVQDAGSRLSRIVEDLFLLARADAGDQPLRADEVYLDELISETAHLVRALAAARGVRINVPVLPEAPFRGDSEMLTRLILNLLDNAIKYSPSDSTVSVRLVAGAHEYEITVADQGPGIPADAQPLIFERFYRLDTSRSRIGATQTGGAGLGLSIARWVAEAHGGRIELAHSDASGSQFRVTLPHDGRREELSPAAAAAVVV